MASRPKGSIIVFLFPLLLCCSIADADTSDPRVSALFRALNAQDVAKLSVRLQQYPSLVNARPDGQTLLSQAASYGFQDLVTLLLQRGANVNARDNNGETPLHQAVESGSRETAVLLIHHGGRDERHPILDAIACDDVPGLTAVLNKLSPDLRDAELAGYDVDEDATTQEPGQKPERVIGIGDIVTRITPVDAAVFWRRRNMIKLLLANGAKIDGNNERGQTPLHEAVGFCDKEIVLELLHAGANVNAKMYRVSDLPSPELLTPLHMAAQGCGSDMIALLVLHGANVNARDSDGETPLFYAIDRGDEPVVMALLNAGAHPNIHETHFGDTPLHEAVIYRSNAKAESVTCAILAQLLAHGANVNAKDKKGLTPLGRAAGDTGIAAFLRKHGGKNFGNA